MACKNLWGDLSCVPKRIQVDLLKFESDDG